MPKKIENLREDILASAREILLNHGYESLTMRTVANRCRIAVGTLYNYYSSKDQLAGSVMLSDWQVIMAETAARCSQAETLPQGLQILHDGVRKFRDLYNEVWRCYGDFHGSRSVVASRHGLLVRQMADCLDPLIARTVHNAPPELGLFLAENVLRSGSDGAVSFDSFLKIVDSLLKAGEAGRRSRA